MSRQASVFNRAVWTLWKMYKELERMEGFEPPTTALERRDSNRTELHSR
jgi:hypothetical protein